MISSKVLSIVVLLVAALCLCSCSAEKPFQRTNDMFGHETYVMKCSSKDFSVCTRKARMACPVGYRIVDRDGEYALGARGSSMRDGWIKVQVMCH